MIKSFYHVAYIYMWWKIGLETSSKLKGAKFDNSKIN
jgi:hypothetical protein